MIQRGLKILFAVLALTAVAGLAAPKFQLGQYRGQIRQALEAGLHRKVEFGEIRFNIFTGPGFSVDNVTIGEDPELGAEPIAYVNSTGKLTAIPRLWSLWTGHLEFSSLRLDDAQINLSRTEPTPGEYRWNVERLMRPSIVAAFPNISIRNSRINFKAENVKSVVYLLNCDLDISPPSSAKDGWHIRFEGKPARTDRAARGSGIFTARGEWKPATGTLDMNLQLDRSQLSDMVALIRGEDAGLQGLVSGSAHLTGPPSALAIGGRLNVADLHGWDQTVSKSEVWPLDLSGRWNVRDQELKLDAGVSGKVAVHYLVTKYFSQPRWGVSLSFQQFAVEPLVNVARRLGAPLPAELKLTGQLDAAIGYSGTLEGSARLYRAAMSIPGSAPVELESAQVTVTNGHATLSPTVVTFPDKQEATFEATYEIGDAAPEFTVTTKDLNVKSLAGVPLLAALQKGDWRGQLRFADSQWSGDFELSKASFGFPGFSDPIFVESADGRLDGARVSLSKLRASAGGIPAEGEYRYEPGVARPHRFRLTAAALDAAALEKLALPAISRKGSIFSFGKPELPEWLRDLRAEGSVRIGSLRLGGLDLAKFETRVVWDGARLTLPDAKAAIGTGMANGRIAMDLAGRSPAYEIVAKLTGVSWRTGKLNADLKVQTNGIGLETLSHLRSTGTFDGHNIIEDYTNVNGKYDLRWSATAPKVSLTDLRLVDKDGEAVTGTGSLQADGMLLMQLANGTRQLKVSLP